jgi:hypothetical protein
MKSRRFSTRPSGPIPQNEPGQIRSEANELVSCGLRKWALHVARPFESSSTRDKISNSVGKGTASGTTARPKRVRMVNGSDFVEQCLAPLNISHRLRLGNLGRDFGWRSILCSLRAATPHSRLPVAFTRDVPKRRRGSVRPRHFAIQIDSRGHIRL